MLTIANFDRYDTLNNPGDTSAAISVWFSGCSAQCDGCHNPLLWDKKNGQEYNVKAVLFTLCSIADKYDRKNIVLIGGEPLEQDATDMRMLVERLSRYGYSVWLYTGWEFEDVPQYIKDNVYTIKCGKYVKELDQQPKFPASSNQRVFRMIDGEWKQINL